MYNYKKIWNLSLAVAILFCLSLISPSISNLGRGLWFTLPVFAIWLLIAIAIKGFTSKKFSIQLKERRFEFLMYIACLFVIASSFILDRGYTADYELTAFLVMGLILLVQLFYSSNGGIDKIITTLIILIGFETLRSLPVLWSSPLVSRLTMAAYDNAVLTRDTSLSGIGQYGFYTGLAIIFPYILSRAFSAKGMIKFLLLISCGSIASAIILSSFMGAALLLSVGCGMQFIFLLISRNKVGYYIVAFLIILILAFSWSTFESSSTGEYLTNKFFNEIEGINQGGLIEGDRTGRGMLWTNSFNTFMESPWFGVGPATGTRNPYMGYVIGGHSSWVDGLAEYGIIGFSVFVLFVASFIKRAVNARCFEPDRFVAFGRIVSCGLYVLCGLYNPALFLTNIFILFQMIVIGSINTSHPSKSFHGMYK